MSCKFNSSAVVQQYNWVVKDTKCSLKRLPLVAEILLSSTSRRTRPLDSAAYLMSAFGRRWAVLFWLPVEKGLPRWQKDAAQVENVLSVGLCREVKNRKAPKVHRDLERLSHCGWWHIADWRKYMKLITLLTANTFGQCVSFSTFASWVCSLKITFAWKEKYSKI